MINGTTLILKYLIFYFLTEMFLASLPMVYTFHNLSFCKSICSHVDDLNNEDLEVGPSIPYPFNYFEKYPVSIK